MLNFSEIDENYLANLCEFLHDYKWIFAVLNTQYVSEEVLIKNRKFLELLLNVNLSDLPELTQPQNDHPKELQKLIENIIKFKINFDTIITDSWKSKAVRKISVKKQYEIENVSILINEVCARDDVRYLIDFGSGLGYLTHYISEKFGFRALGLEGSSDHVQKALQHQLKYFPNSIGKVKHLQHFITSESENFILDNIHDDVSDIAIFGLHGCGDLTVTAINLFLTMKRVKKLIFMPCCYHKMSMRDLDDFNFFPLSEELNSILQKYPKFLNRPFLRLAGQQSPKKWKDMSETDHFIHGKNMFERGLVEALISNDSNETSKRINNVTISDGPVVFENIKLKYQLLDKSSGKSKEWTTEHEKMFIELRAKYPDGELMSEKLFCFQCCIQTNCENLVLIDRVKYIEEQGRLMNLKLKTTVKKLQNDKLTPRCLIVIVEK